MNALELHAIRDRVDELCDHEVWERDVPGDLRELASRVFLFWSLDTRVEQITKHALVAFAEEYHRRMMEREQ